MIERKGLIVYFEDKEVLNKLDKNTINCSHAVGGIFFEIIVYFLIRLNK